MQVKEIMTTDVEVIRPEATIRDAAARMKALDVGSLPVCNGRKILGIITDRDITIRAVAENKNPGSTSVEEIMTRDIKWCFDDEDVTDMTAKMESNQIRRIPVVNRDKLLVGICSLGDLAISDATSKELSGEVLREISKTTVAH